MIKSENNNIDVNRHIEKIIQDLSYITSVFELNNVDGIDIQKAFKAIVNKIVKVKESLQASIQDIHICTKYVRYHLYGYDANIKSSQKCQLAPDINLYGASVDFLIDQFFSKTRCVSSLIDYPMEFQIFKEVRMMLPNDDQIQIRINVEKYLSEYNTIEQYQKVNEIILSRKEIMNNDECRRLLYAHPGYKAIVDSYEAKKLADLEKQEKEKALYKKIKVKNDVMMWEHLNSLYGKMTKDEIDKLKTII